MNVHSARRLLCLLLLAAALGACSTTRLAYNNAEWLISRSVNSYVNLSRAQSRTLRAELREHLDWHCRTQLPGYIAWLDRLELTASADALEAQALEGLRDDLSEAVTVLTQRITPTTVRVLSELNAQQKQELARKLAEKNEELYEEYVAPPLPQQIEERAERLEERLHRWLGELTPAQRERIQLWSQALDDQNRHWLENRRVWQENLLQALVQPKSDFPARIAELLQHPQRFHTQAWARRAQASSEEAMTLATELLTLMNERQRQRLNKALSKLRNDFTALSCA